MSEKVLVNLVLTLLGEAASPDELRALRAWLLEEDELRGCIQTRERPPGPDRLGPVLDALQIAADPAVAVLTASLVAWLKTRVGSVRLVLTLGSGGKVELEAKKVRGLDADALAELTERLARFVSDDSGGHGPAEKTNLSKGVQEPIQGKVDRSDH